MSHPMTGAEYSAVQRARDEATGRASAHERLAQVQASMDEARRRNRPPILCMSPEPNRPWVDDDLTDAVWALGWYADAEHLGHPDPEAREQWRRHCVNSHMGTAGQSGCSAQVTRKGMLLGFEDQSICLVPWRAILAAIPTGPAIGQQLSLLEAA